MLTACASYEDGGVYWDVRLWLPFGQRVPLPSTQGLSALRLLLLHFAIGVDPNEVAYEPCARALAALPPAVRQSLEQRALTTRADRLAYRDRALVPVVSLTLAQADRLRLAQQLQRAPVLGSAKVQHAEDTAPRPAVLPSSQLCVRAERRPTEAGPLGSSAARILSTRNSRWLHAPPEDLTGV